MKLISLKNQKSAIIAEIIKMLKECEDMELIDLIYIMLLKK